MNKKVVGIFVCTLLIATSMPALGDIKEDTKPSEQSKLIISIDIMEPEAGWIYIMGNPVFHIASLSMAVILGPITFKVNLTHDLPIECVDWYVDGIQEEQFTGSQYYWNWPMISAFPGLHDVKVEVIDYQSNTDDDFVQVIKIL